MGDRSSSIRTADRTCKPPTIRALTFRCLKHANSSSKSFDIGSLESCPLAAEILDSADAGVGRDGAPELTVGSSIVLE